jgi:hypothetical protein
MPRPPKNRAPAEAGLPIRGEKAVNRPRRQRYRGASAGSERGTENGLPAKARVEAMAKGFDDRGPA